MKAKKILSFTIVLVLLVSLFTFAPTANAASDNPVKLIYAKPEITDYNKLSATGYVEVENIAYEKNVTIHYSYDGITWQDTSAEYYKPTWGNYEAWKFQTPAVTLGYREHATITFAIKYEVNGQTYWDNNNGKNYSVAAGYETTSRYDFGSGGVAAFYSYRISDSYPIQGSLQLKDLDYEKDVKVQYTTDNWETVNEVNAEYGYTFEENNSVQIWNYQIPYTKNQVTYKILYTVNGITYVDDNFGEYYTV